MDRQTDRHRETTDILTDTQTVCVCVCVSVCQYCFSLHGNSTSNSSLLPVLSLSFFLQASYVVQKECSWAIRNFAMVGSPDMVCLWQEIL